MFEGEKLCVHGHGADEVVLVGGDSNVGAFPSFDFDGWDGFFIVFVGGKVGKRVPRTAGVEVCPDARTSGGIDGGGEEGESEYGRIHGCKV